MKSLLGILQFACVIGGTIAAVNGQWPMLVVGFVAAGGIGFLGNRAVGAIDGISEGGRQAVGMVARAHASLERRNYDVAAREIKAAIRSFRIGGDKGMLMMALALEAVVFAAKNDAQGARRSVSESRELLKRQETKMSHDTARESFVIRQIHSLVDRALHERSKDPERLIEDYGNLIEQLG